MFNRQFKKQLIYFGGAFLLTSLMVFLYSVYELIRYQKPIADSLANVWALPILITSLLLVYEIMLGFISRKFKGRHAGEDFNQQVSKAVLEQLQYGKEDFKALREDLKFQKALTDVYTIYTEGETKVLNYQSIRDRFKPEESSLKVIEIVIEEANKLTQK